MSDKDVTEKEVQAKITKWLAKRDGVWFTKSVLMNSNGVPDLLICYRGVFIALEVKRPVGGRLSALQKIQIEAIEKAGGVARVVRSLDEVKEIINKIDDDINNIDDDFLS